MLYEDDRTVLAVFGKSFKMVRVEGECAIGTVDEKT